MSGWMIGRNGSILKALEKPQMEPRAEVQRREVRYSGRVQGVGFRYTVCRIAQHYPVTGYVKNLGDGSVELVVEGSAQDLDSLLAAVRAEMGRYIRDVRATPGRASGAFSDFDIRY